MKVDHILPKMEKLIQKIYILKMIEYISDTSKITRENISITVVRNIPATLMKAFEMLLVDSIERFDP